MLGSRCGGQGPVCFLLSRPDLLGLEPTAETESQTPRVPSGSVPADVAHSSKSGP